MLTFSLLLHQDYVDQQLNEFEKLKIHHTFTTTTTPSGDIKSEETNAQEIVAVADQPNEFNPEASSSPPPPALPLHEGEELYQNCSSLPEHHNPQDLDVDSLPPPIPPRSTSIGSGLSLEGGGGGGGDSSTITTTTTTAKTEMYMI